jgi:hypothetical protein
MFRPTHGHIQAIKILQGCELNLSYIYSCLLTEIPILHKNMQIYTLKILLKKLKVRTKYKSRKEFLIG